MARALLVLACLLESKAGLAQGAPIRIGAISSLSGPGASPESVRGAQAVIEATNAAGGIHGRRLILISEDDRTDPKIAVAAARRLISDDSIVALVGGSSVLECAVNYRQYEKAGLISIPGGGVDPACFNSRNIAPINAGPYVSLANALTFAQRHLHAEKLCVVSPALPGMMEAFQQVIEQWGHRLQRSSPPMELFKLGDPLEPVVRRLIARSCQAVVFTGPNVIEWVHYARPLLPDAKHIFLTPAYTTFVLQTLGDKGEGIYAMAEFEPWSSRSLQLNDWRYLMTAHKVPLSSLSQGGYLAAQIFVKVINNIAGPITRETVTQALREMTPVSNTLTAGFFTVGNANQHNPNRSAIPMLLKDKGWRVAHPEWITFESH